MSDDQDRSGSSEMMTTEEAARYLGLRPRTLEKHRVYGDFVPFVRYSNRFVRYRRCDLDAFIERHRASSTSEMDTPERPKRTAASRRRQWQDPQE
jgi:hypothetical protein